MKICIDKSELMEALDTAEKAVSKKTTLPILEGFLLEADGDVLRVTGNDLETGIQYTAKAEVLKPGSIVVNANLFINTIRKMPDEEIDLTLNGNRLLIEAGKTETEVATMAAQGYPALPNPKGKRFVEVDQQEFKEMVSKVAFSVGCDENRPQLKGIFIDFKGGKLNVVACDGFRMAIRSSAAADIDFSMLISGKVLFDISKTFKSGKMRIYVNNNQALFEADNFYTTTSILEGQYLNYESFKIMDKVVTARVNVKDLKPVLEMAILFEPDRNKPPIVFDIKDKITASYISELGKTKDVIEAEISGENFKLGLNPKQVLDVLRNVEDEEVIFEFGGEKRPIFIIPVKGDKYFHLCTPVLFKEG